MKKTLKRAIYKLNLYVMEECNCEPILKSARNFLNYVQP